VPLAPASRRYAAVPTDSAPRVDAGPDARCALVVDATGNESATSKTLAERGHHPRPDRGRRFVEGLPLPERASVRPGFLLVELLAIVSALLSLGGPEHGFRHSIHQLNHPVLRSMAPNLALLQDAVGNHKAAKNKSEDRIDGIVALILR
jgi:hypothetical protein